MIDLIDLDTVIHIIEPESYDFFDEVGVSREWKAHSALSML